ncbi:hypothetical protein EC9_00270 [Rosistilla ulvae]|uniref:Uncharacterized protein n=1 Tax=Rosistilla ulvae TaxID=1930277 RepID=A0A517LTB6_9BACT|nr:hypothetical protein EC9_00270 [Rosistilla ulvae]
MQISALGRVPLALPVLLDRNCRSGMNRQTCRSQAGCDSPLIIASALWIIRSQHASKRRLDNWQPIRFRSLCRLLIEPMELLHPMLAIGSTVGSSNLWGLRSRSTGRASGTQRAFGPAGSYLQISALRRGALAEPVALKDYSVRQGRICRYQLSVEEHWQSQWHSKNIRSGRVAHADICSRLCATGTASALGAKLWKRNESTNVPISSRLMIASAPWMIRSQHASMRRLHYWQPIRFRSLCRLLIEPMELLRSRSTGRASGTQRTPRCDNATPPAMASFDDRRHREKDR